MFGEIDKQNASLKLTRQPKIFNQLQSVNRNVKTPTDNVQQVLQQVLWVYDMGIFIIDDIYCLVPWMSQLHYVPM